MKKIALLLCLLLSITFVPEITVLASDVSSAGSETSSLPSEPATEISDEVDIAKLALDALVGEREVLAVVYLADEYIVRAQPSTSAEAVITIPSGQQAFVQGVQMATNAEPWARVLLNVGDASYEGFVQRANLALSDERFLAWEKEYGMNPPRRAAFSSAYADIAQFPEDYHKSLMTLKNAHPNWTFVKFNTNLEWNTVIHEETQGARSLVPNSFAEYMRGELYGSQGWSYASKLAVEYYMDPRLWLNEEYIFMFEQLTYNASYHTEAPIQTILNGTFMQGVVPGDGRSYANVFWETGKNLGVSPFHLASRVYSEQGINGSRMITGDWPGFENLYNYYNISASGSTTEQVMTGGLTRARKEGWDTPLASIQGGARILAANYILKGQDTLYLQKFDVDPTGGLYIHQYMQAVHSPASESRKIRQQYEGAGAINNTFVFKIPVYNNMPAETSVLPTTNFNISLQPPEGYSDARIYLDGVEYAATAQGATFVANAGGAQAKSAVMYKYDGNGTPVGMYAWALHYRDGNYTVTPVPELENLLSYHGFSIRIVGKAGIRIKSAISADLRGRLISGGVDGFTLKEYGTLVMNNATRSAQYPLVKGGEKVTQGLAYGTAANGQFMDAVYESVDGRYRYTTVLVGMPANQYKTEFAFRGYITLHKDGKDYIFYGAPMARSIYSLAEQTLAGGYYAAGSEPDIFLHNIINTAE